MIKNCISFRILFYLFIAFFCFNSKHLFSKILSIHPRKLEIKAYKGESYVSYLDIVFDHPIETHDIKTVFYGHEFDRRLNKTKKNTVRILIEPNTLHSKKIRNGELRIEADGEISVISIYGEIMPWISLEPRVINFGVIRTSLKTGILSKTVRLQSTKKNLTILRVHENNSSFIHTSFLNPPESENPILEVKFDFSKVPKIGETNRVFRSQLLVETNLRQQKFITIPIIAILQK